MKLATYEPQEPSTAPAPDVRGKTLSELAAIVKSDWHPVNFAARPYLQAMSELNGMRDKYGADPAVNIVVYFLSNASQWRGETAKAVKAELKRQLKAAGF